jgi:hypothetical protein
MALDWKVLDVAVLLVECIRKTDRVCILSHICIEAAMVIWQNVSIGLCTSRTPGIPQFLMYTLGFSSAETPF